MALEQARMFMEPEETDDLRALAAPGALQSAAPASSAASSQAAAGPRLGSDLTDLSNETEAVTGVKPGVDFRAPTTFAENYLMGVDPTFQQKFFKPGSSDRYTGTFVNTYRVADGKMVPIEATPADIAKGDVIFYVGGAPGSEYAGESRVGQAYTIKDGALTPVGGASSYKAPEKTPFFKEFLLEGVLPMVLAAAGPAGLFEGLGGALSGGALTGSAASSLGSGAFNLGSQILAGKDPIDALKSTALSYGAGQIANQLNSMLPQELGSVGRQAVSQLITAGKIDPLALATTAGVDFAADTLAQETGISKASAGQLIRSGLQLAQGNQTGALSSLISSGALSGTGTRPTGGLADYGDINTQGQERGVNERTYSEGVYDALLGALSGAQGEQSLADKEQVAGLPLLGGVIAGHLGAGLKLNELLKARGVTKELNDPTLTSELKTPEEKALYNEWYKSTIGKWDPATGSTQITLNKPADQSLTVQSSRVPSGFTYNDFTQSFPYVDEFGDVHYVDKKDLNIDPELKWLKEIYFPEPITIDTEFDIADPIKVKTKLSTSSSSQSDSSQSDSSQLTDSQLTNLTSGLDASQLKSSSTSSGLSGLTAESGGTPSGGTPGGETPGGGTTGGETAGGDLQPTQAEVMKKLGDELLAQGKSQEEVTNELNRQLEGTNLRAGFKVVNGQPSTNIYESKVVDRTRSGEDYAAIRSGLSQKFSDGKTAAQDLAADINTRMRTANGIVYDTMEEAIRARNPGGATGPSGDRPKASDYAYQYVFNKVYGRPGTEDELKYARTRSISELESDLSGFLSDWKSSQPAGEGTTGENTADTGTPVNVETGTSGVSGESGVSGTSGVSGFSGVSGQSGTSGISGFSGSSGASGFSGVSGLSGASGFSGVSGQSGVSGFSGFSGESGTSGFSGFSGESGASGWSGVSGESGVSGFSGMSGESGTSGFSGFSGESGVSGFSGFSGLSGDSGFSGASGVSGTSGFSGFSGESGISGYSGASGVSGISGFSGFSGVSGESGSSGYSGASGVSGFSGASGISGESGFSGFSGVSGVSGFSGTSGVSGKSGFSGFSGVSGVSGVSGFSGFSGAAGRDGKAVYAPAAVVSSIAAAPAAIDWLGQRMLESKTRGGYQDPLAEFRALQQDIEKESLLKQLQPDLANVLAERNAMPYYSYGQEPPIEDVLGLPGGESSSYNESDYVPMFKTGGKVSPLNIQMMYAKGGHTREDFRDGKHVAGPGDGQSDDIPAWLADGEFVFPADVVSALGNGSTKAGTEKLYDMMHEIRARARSSREKDLPPPAHKSPLDYLKTKKGK